jgi:uncharacterized protein with HEPN domain
MNPREYLRFTHMLEMGETVANFVKGRTREDLDADQVFMMGLRMVIALIGEAASQIPRATQANYGQIPWPQIIGMRNRLIHGYDEVNLDLVWHTATQHIPIMVTLLREVLDALPPSDPEAGEADAK